MKRTLCATLCGFSLLAFSVSAVFSAVAVFPTSANAEYRIATVDLGRVLNETKEAKTRKEKLDAMTAAARKKIQDKREELKSLEEKAVASKKGDLSPEVAQFESKQRDFARYVKDNEEEIKSEFIKVNKALTSAAMKTIQDYAKDNRYDLVLSKSEQDRSLVLFGDSRTDITDQIIKKLNS